MTIALVKQQLDDYLESLRSVLVTELSLLLKELNFKYERGFGADDVVGIFFEYETDKVSLFSYPINRQTMIVAAPKMLLKGKEFPESIEANFNKYLHDNQIDDDEIEVLSSELLQYRLTIFEQWFEQCWAVAKAHQPHLRGFLAIHDTIWYYDLDRKQEVREDELEGRL